MLLPDPCTPLSLSPTNIFALAGSVPAFASDDDGEDYDVKARVCSHQSDQG